MSKGEVAATILISLLIVGWVVLVLMNIDKMERECEAENGTWITESNHNEYHEYCRMEEVK